MKETQKLQMQFRLFFLGSICLFLFCTCKKDKVNEFDYSFTPYKLNTPIGFPEPIIPDNNPLSNERVELGKMLFFDPILSRDSSISCGTCHLQNLAFTDNLTISRGIDNREGFRNTATLTNILYNDFFLKEGGIPSLERQVSAPIEDEDEMGFNMVELIERLKNHPTYPDLIWQAYEREVDAFSITRAIACYERTLISGNSKYDKFYYQDQKDILTEEEKLGMDLFFSDKTNCSTCHSDFNFTNNGFENNGLYETYADPGRIRITNKEIDEGKFKVPTLRNILQTDPYMHNGSLQTLESVIEHYNSGGSNHPNKSELVRPLDLSEEEKQALIAFLETLSDWEFLGE